ncbi:MAG: N-acetylmuramoyl-L-alanine amidase [Desulfuromonadales bacterium]
MMNRFVILLLVLFALVPPVTVCAESADQAYRKARESYYALQNSARKQMYREQWQKVFDRFQAVYERFPDTRRGGDALYMCGKTMAGLYNISRIEPDAERAVALFEDMARVYPASNLADDALLQAGELLEEALHDKTRAYRVYQRLVEILPRGDMHGKAKQRLQALAQYAPPSPPVAETPVIAEPEVAKGSDRATATESAARDDSLLSAIRFWSNPGYTRVVLDVTNEAHFSTHYLAADANRQNPARLYIDIEGVGLDAALQEITRVDDGLLQQIRTGRPRPNTVRVVFDLESLGDYKVFPLNDPWRIVIDIAGDQAPVLKRDEVQITALPKTDQDAIARVLNQTPEAPPLLHLPKTPVVPALRRIVIDAGHGGKDPGAVGPSGVLEKDVTLKLAKALASELTRVIGCEVILTRSDDVYLPLEERTAIANKVGADLFVSLHANANRSRKAYGIETYYLNFSKNDKAAAVAARENGTTLQQVSDLELILFDLMANAKINESSRLAAAIQKSLVEGISRKYSNVRNLGVRQGPFYVLLGATMPSVLVETAFISHPREEKRLTSSAYQKSAARAIASAIKEYAISNNMIASR